MPYTDSTTYLCAGCGEPTRVCECPIIVSRCCPTCDALAAEVATLRELLRTSHTDGLHWKTWRQWKAARDAALAAPTSAAGSTPTNQDNPGDNP